MLDLGNCIYMAIYRDNEVLGICRVHSRCEVLLKHLRQGWLWFWRWRLSDALRNQSLLRSKGMRERWHGLRRLAGIGWEAAFGGAYAGVAGERVSA